MIPKGLIVHLPITGRRANRISLSASKALVRDRIYHHRLQKSRLTAITNQIKQSLSEIVTLEDRNRIITACTRSYQATHDTCKARHIRKFQALIHAIPEAPQLQPHRIVINKSNRNISETETKVLAKGLNFAKAPKAYNDDIVSSIESVTSRLTHDRADELRWEIRNALTRMNKPRPNLSRVEEIAIRTLRRDETIRILPADKGNATVVMNTAEYNHKLAEIVSDTDKFKQLTRNPTKKFETMIRNLVKKHKLPISLAPNYTRPPHLYGLPKIHKPDVPLRPIVSCIDSAAHQLAKFLVKIIGPLQTSIASAVKNSAELVNRLRTIDVQTEDQMISFDVKSLFTSVPRDDALEVLRSKLELDDQLAARTELSIDSVMELVTACVTTTYFRVEETYYQQVDGLAMGSPLSPAICNIYMEQQELNALQSSQQVPTLWLRYVDDIFAIWPHGRQDLDHFLDHLNSRNPAIQYTMELEEDSVLPFLDVKIQKNEHHLSMSVFRKKTHTDRYLHYTSNHPTNVKRGIVRCLAERAKRVCSSNIELTKEQKSLEQAFRANGYPIGMIRRAMSQEARTPAQQEQDNRPIAVLPYIGPGSEKLKRICARHNIKVVFSSKETLRRSLCQTAPKTELNETKNCVYEVPCLGCETAYIGQTKRHLKVRLAEHKRSLQMAETSTSGIAQHCWDHSHGADWGNTKVLCREANRYRREIRESIEMTKAGTRNYAEPSVTLSNIWRPLLRRKTRNTAGQHT